MQSSPLSDQCKTIVLNRFSLPEKYAKIVDGRQYKENTNIERLGTIALLFTLFGASDGR